MKANETKSTHITFTLKRSSCPPVQLNSTYLIQPDNAKYLGIYLARRVTWRKNITTKIKKPGPTVPKNVLDPWTKFAIIP